MKVFTLAARSKKRNKERNKMKLMKKTMLWVLTLTLAMMGAWGAMAEQAAFGAGTTR